MIIPHAKVGSSLKNKTGGWRSQKPIFNPELCKKCGLCQLHCPENCISGVEMDKKVEERSVAKTDYDFCKGCGICAKVCPFGAIKMVEEEK